MQYWLQKKINKKVKVTSVFFSDDLDAAKSVAASTVKELKVKGFDSWAKRVKLVRPITADGLFELSEMAAEFGHELDWNSQGNSFQGQKMIDWANTLRLRADQLANSESYAD
jgi:hypothetical protein